MSFKPSGVTYTKTEVPKNAQAFSGFTVIGLKIEYPWIIHFSLILYQYKNPLTKIQIDIVRVKDVDYICLLNWKLQCITFW